MWLRREPGPRRRKVGKDEDSGERGENERNAARRKEGKGRPWTAARPGRGVARGEELAADGEGNLGGQFSRSRAETLEGILRLEERSECVKQTACFSDAQVAGVRERGCKRRVWTSSTQPT